MKFQRLLEMKDGKVTGPMSPVLAAQNFIELSGVKSFSGLCRLENNQSYDYTFDHLIICKRYKNDTAYWLVVDRGIEILPVGFMFLSEQEVVLTPVYEEYLKDPQKRINDLVDMEARSPKRCPDNPVMRLKKEHIKNIFLEAEKSGKLNPKRYEEPSQ